MDPLEEWERDVAIPAVEAFAKMMLPYKPAHTLVRNGRLTLAGYSVIVWASKELVPDVRFELTTDPPYESSALPLS